MTLKQWTFITCKCCLLSETYHTFNVPLSCCNAILLLQMAQQENGTRVASRQASMLHISKYATRQYIFNLQEMGAAQLWPKMILCFSGLYKRWLPDFPGICVTALRWHGHNAFSQWQHTFHLKALLPLPKTDCCSNTGPRIGRRSGYRGDLICSDLHVTLINWRGCYCIEATPINILWKENCRCCQLSF